MVKNLEMERKKRREREREKLEYCIRTIFRSAGTSNSRESNNLLADDVNGQFCFLGGVHTYNHDTRVP